jgi:hypothetical protein
MKNIKQRHWLVDVGFLIAGGFFSASVQTKSIGYGIAAAAIAGLTIVIDRRNVEDEEHEIEEAYGKNN